MNRAPIALAVLLIFGSPIEIADAVTLPKCSMTPPPMSVSRPNIFSEQQEQWLGHQLADMIEPRYMLLPEKDSTYLTQIGQRLLAELPPTKIQYSFRIFESADVRSFSLTGGHVYVSRKLILEARNEDELAGMVAHEIGRVYTHHGASLATLRLNKMLGVKSLGGEEDVADKLQRLQNIPIQASAQLNGEDQEKDDVLADRVGIYAMVKAGYSPEAFVSFLDRINLNGGYTGNFLTDLFDATPQISVRIRKAQKVIGSLPKSCRVMRAQYHPQFKAFQAALGDQRINPMVPATSGLKYLALDPPLSPALESVRLSPDRKYLLAQDELRVHVFKADPPQLLFSIDAPGAQMAQFTPNSANVVFNYDTLRVENWDIASKQLAGVLDFADYVGCLQTSLSPDGNTLACFSLNNDAVWLRLTDLRSGRVIYQDMNFYVPNSEFQPAQMTSRYFNEQRQAAVTWSQDGRYFLAASGTAVAGFDIKAGRPVKLGGNLSKLFEGRFAFVDSNKLLFDCDWGTKDKGSRDRFKMCYTGFPDGQPIKGFELGRVWVGPLTCGPHVLTGPAENAAAAVLDPASGLLGQKFKLETVDLCGGTIAKEADGGGVSVGTIGGAMSTVPVPISPLQTIEAGTFSADGRYLAISNRARGAVWDLSTSKMMVSTGPFRAANFDKDDKLQARVEDHELKPAANNTVDRLTHKFVSIPTVAAQKARYGDVLVRFRPLDPDERTINNVAIEGFDATTGEQLWSRRFSNNVPTLVPTADGDRLLLIADRRSEAGADESGHNRKLLVRTSDEIREFYERGLVVEVISIRTGQPEHVLAAPELVPTDGGADPRTASLYGDLLAIYGSHNNTVVYRVADGRRLVAFFGRAIAGDSKLGMIAATDRAQDVLIYDAESGKEILRVTLDHYPLLARFIPEKKQLFVLTATQRVYMLDLPAKEPALVKAEK